MFTNSTSEQALLSKRFFLVLEVVAGGLTFYAATDHIRPVSSSSGQIVVIDAILGESPVVELDEGWGASENEPPLVTFKLPITNLVKDLRDAGLLTSFFVQTYLWVEGTDWDFKELLCSGYAEYSADDGSSGFISVVVKQDVGEGGGVLPLLSDRIPEEVGASAIFRQQYLPFVFGAAPDVSYPVTVRPYPFKAVPYTGSEGLQNYKMILAKGEHGLDADVFVVCDDPDLEKDADTVSVQYATSYNITTIDVETDPIGVGSSAWGLSYYYHTYGRPMGNFNSKPIRGLGDLGQALLDGSGATVDRVKASQFAQSLNSYFVAGQIDEPTSCLDYIKDEITKLFPVSLMSGPQGLWLQPWALTTPDDGGKVYINPQELAGVRTSPVERDSESVINDFSVQAGYCRLRNIYTLKYAITADRTTNQSSQILRKSFVCEASKALYGVRAEAEESNIVYDVGTLNLLIEQRISAKAFAKPRVSYSLPVQYGWLRPGDFVKLFDADVRLSGTFLINTLTLSESGPILGLVGIRETLASFEEKASVISPF